MRRALAVVLVGILVGIVSGIDDTALAVAQAQESPEQVEARVRKVARRVADLPPYAVVRVRRTDGTTTVLLVQEVRPDALVGTRAEGNDHSSETIPYAAISRVDEVKGRALRKVLKGATWALAIVGIAFGALLVACAASAPALQPSASDPETVRPDIPVPPAKPGYAH